MPAAACFLYYSRKRGRDWVIRQIVAIPPQQTYKLEWNRKIILYSFSSTSPLFSPILLHPHFVLHLNLLPVLIFFCLCSSMEHAPNTSTSSLCMLLQTQQIQYHTKQILLHCSVCVCVCVCVCVRMCVCVCVCPIHMHSDELNYYICSASYCSLWLLMIHPVISSTHVFPTYH